jgi:hypothetical protein
VIGLLALARRRGWSATSAVAAFSVVGALASVVVLAAVYSPVDTNRAYYAPTPARGQWLVPLSRELAG